MRTTVQRVALIFGVVFILVALLGFLTDGGTRMGTEDPGLVLNLFPVNVLHNVVHLLFGIWGVAASRSWGASKTYCQAGGVIYIVLTILGLVAPDLGGLIPIGGNDVWLHALLGIALAYFGFTAREAPARATV